MEDLDGNRMVILKMKTGSRLNTCFIVIIVDNMSLVLVIFKLRAIFTSPPEGVARYCFHPVCLCVCLSVCVSVCPADILVFYFSAIRRDIDLKFIQDTYMVVLNSLK